MRIFIITTFLIAVMWVSSAGAQPPDSCNFEELTQSCAAFSADGPQKIVLSDGSYFPNVVAISKLETDENYLFSLSRKIASTEKNRPEYLRLKQKLVSLVGEVSDQKVDGRFKYFLIENFTDFFEFLFFKQSLYGLNFEVPWPIEKPIGTKSISQKELAARFVASFTREQLTQMESIFREMKTLQAFSAKRVSIDSVNDVKKNISTQQEGHISKLFEFAKMRLVNLISVGKPSSEISSTEQALIRKVQTVKLNSINKLAPQLFVRCIDNFPNGFYSNVDHSVSLCPISYFLPDVTLIYLLTHELAHSIGPCLSQFGTYEIRSDRLVNLGQSLLGGNPRELTKDPNRAVLFGKILEINQMTNVTAYQFPLFSSNSAMNYFIDKKVLRSEIPGVESLKYPFKKVLDCLSSKQGFRGIDANEIRKLASEVSSSRAKYREPSFDRATDERQIVDALSAYPGCISPEKESQLDEAMSDWFAAKVLGDYLSGNFLKTQNERLAMVAILAGEVCWKRHQAKSHPNLSNLEILEQLSREQLWNGDAHPASKMRIEKIIFGEPNIRNALGCVPQRDLACER